MKWTLAVQILFICSIVNIIQSFAYDCLTRHDNYRCRLGTKTPYRFIANHDDTPFEFPGCTEKKIWLIVRHGTRYSGSKYIPFAVTELPKLQKIILDNYYANKTDLTPEDVELLTDWKTTFAKGDVKKLTEEGEDEMMDLAERYQSRFPSLMPEDYDNLTYKFKYTATQRTEESAKHFTAGLFGWHKRQSVWYPEAEHMDPVLRFYKRCFRWRKEVDKNPNALIEMEKFMKSEPFTKMIHDISKRIGYHIDNETVRFMHTICGFETAWYKDKESPWCKILSLHDFKVLEFVEDLEYYWIDGYGYKLTYEQACPALKDMFRFFESSKEHLVSVYFTHSGTILKLLALLGVAKDDHVLTHDLFPLYANDRAWRTSMIDAFASNIAFVLYECESGGPSILFMHQERPVYLPGCPLNVPCPLSIMKALYPDHDEECQFEAMCRVSKSPES